MIHTIIVLLILRIAFRSIDFSTISLAFRLLDDRECCLGISAEAEKALRDLLHSDILNLDQRRTRKPQTGESEVTSDSKLLNTYLTGQSVDTM